MRAHSKVHANRETTFGDAILRIIPLGNFYFQRRPFSYSKQ